MPKILQINSAANSASTGRIAEQIGLLAKADGCDSYIAYGRIANKSQSKLIRIGNNLSVRLHGIESLLFDNHGLSSSLATRQFINAIKEIGPDIIHLHNIHGYYLNYQLLFEFLSSMRIPVVWTLHDCWPFTGHCSYYSDIDCQKWQKQCGQCPKIHNYPKSLFWDRSERNYRIKKECFNSITNLTLVPVSHWLEDEVKKSFLAKHNVHCILNGIDIEQFKPKENLDYVRDSYGLNGKKILLGVATAWGPRKGWADYIKLSGMLSKDYQIVMVGVTEKKAKELPSNILVIKRTESVDELAELYSVADVVLNLSDEESFGLTTAEGFACGTPSIVYNCTASPELITTETGFVLEKGDLEGVVKAIYAITTNGKEHYAGKCRERAVSLYDKNKNYSQYIELYNELLNK